MISHWVKMITQSPWNFMVLYFTLLLGINIKLAHIFHTGGDARMLLGEVGCSSCLVFSNGSDCWLNYHSEKLTKCVFIFLYLIGLCRRSWTSFSTGLLKMVTRFVDALLHGSAIS
jgi:hypothetical protein